MLQPEDFGPSPWLTEVGRGGCLALRASCQLVRRSRDNIGGKVLASGLDEAPKADSDGAERIFTRNKTRDS